MELLFLFGLVMGLCWCSGMDPLTALVTSRVRDELWAYSEDDDYVSVRSWVIPNLVYDLTHDTYIQSLCRENEWCLLQYLEAESPEFWRHCLSEWLPEWK